MKNKKTVTRYVRATAVCASFEIEVTGSFKSHGLSSEENEDVRRKLKQNLTDAIAKLPFAHIYPCEVKISR